MAIAFLRWIPAFFLFLLLALGLAACDNLPLPVATDTPATQTRPASPVPTEPAPSEAQLDISVARVPDGLPDYDRDDWRHWTDADGDCRNTRHEVLAAESESRVTFQTERGCKVAAGRWYGAYTDTTVTDPARLDVDHLVPLANAHKSGGWAWTAERKRDYANSLADPEHLIAVTAGANRAKGAKGPEEWRPANRAYWCQYATAWIRVKQTWGLSATSAEAAALQDMLSACANAPELVPGEGGSRPAIVPSPDGSAAPSPETGTAAPAPPPDEGGAAATPAAAGVYPSCDAAAAAGELRALGSQGSGRGFPKAMVPSARDGDGDGMVCER